TRHHEHTSSGLRQGEPKAHRRGATHDPGTGIVIGMGFTEMRRIFCGAGQTRNNQKILRITDQFWHRLTAVEHTRLTAARRAPSAEDIAWHDVSSPCKASRSIPDAYALKCFGADQTLRQQHSDCLASLIDHGTGRLERYGNFLRLVNAHADEAARLENRLYGLPHRHLPGVAITEITTHADQDEHGELAVFNE